ncbi:MAG: zinc-dependent metalloprotease [Bacteroidota bacterium]
MLVSLKRLFFLLVCLINAPGAFNQKKSASLPNDSIKPKIALTTLGSTGNFSKSALKNYKDVITDKAITSHGMFKVHKVEEKIFFEIPDSLFKRDILTVARISKGAVGVRSGFSGYAGDEISENVVRFERGPNNKLFIKNVIYQETGRDSVEGMYWNVINSNMQPIAASFDIKALSPDSNRVVIDVTDLVNGDNEILFFDGSTKRQLGIGGIQSDKSYINRVQAYPENIEMNTVKTYSRSGSMSGNSNASQSQNATFELNASLVLLPKVPMKPRYFDDRIGYITTESITDFDLNPQGVERIRFIRRFRLEPKAEDLEKYKRGELVEPAKPIVYFIDPTTPRKWVPYLLQGINDWQAAFEKAGFKNAIIGKLSPSKIEDSTWSIEDARHNAIIYKPSDVANASGPSIIDPRSGEILEAHINWYHNIMALLRNWYFVQTAAVDSRARKLQLDDTLMGQLIRFASSHEVGHTLGLMHNFGSSSTVPVEKLRDKAFLETYGHTPSIMDYARFNYVAQPEDGIPVRNLLPRIGDYDLWAIEWGYRYLPQFKNADDEKSFLNKWAVEKLTGNTRLFWGDGENNRDDPRNQTEDLGDNAMKASTYGVKNLQRIIASLPAWTSQADKDYTDLKDMYTQVITQFARYCNHVVSNIGGIERTPKRLEQPGPVYNFTKKTKQQEAMEWLQSNVFKTPVWLVNKNISSLTNQNPQSTISLLQDRAMNYLLGTNTISKLLRYELEEPAKAYTVTAMMADLRKGIFSELPSRKPVDMYRRILQKSYVEKLMGMINTDGQGIVFSFGSGGGNVTPGLSKTSDAISITRAELRSLQLQVKTAIPGYADAATRNHLLDISERIEKTLNPK